MQGGKIIPGSTWQKFKTCIPQNITNSRPYGAAGASSWSCPGSQSPGWYITVLRIKEEHFIKKRKYRNAEYTAAACKFWGGKFVGCRGKHLFGRGQSILGSILGSISGWISSSILGFNIGFKIRLNNGFNIGFNIVF